MDYRYINHDELAQIIRTGQAGKTYQVVDVRDEDFRGGNIKGAIRAPSEQRTDQSVQDLVTRLDSVPQVIFHCTLSQVRGPKAARIYAEARREKEKQQGVQQRDASATPATGSHEQEEDLETAKEKARTFAPDPYAAAKATVADRAQTRQEVFVLRDGFQNWQGLYRKDADLVENFDPHVWQEYSP
ncbi:hypothetical protein BMF94_4764 [Rhodotorula taiwanensis]|uniref:Rhodanese domain-containing protein n=1 Tax=Rhodotorula taiwanensis TaxID=741276 RepID=A0A2S5B677_9BASI|nr:hypothetical protein BMF94_4764 [Rhodotorula taiwanensis]